MWVFAGCVCVQKRHRLNTYPAIPMPLGPITHKPNCNHYRPTPHPPPTAATPLLPTATALHQPANHPQTNNSAYPRALKRGGRRRRTPPRPPTTTTIGNTYPPVRLKPLNLDSSLYSTSLLPDYRLPDTNTTLPLLIIIIGDCRLVQQAATPPIPPYP